MPRLESSIEKTKQYAAHLRQRSRQASIGGSIRGKSLSIIARTLLQPHPKSRRMIVAKPVELRLFAGAY
jgi:hypothetical protein